MAGLTGRLLLFPVIKAESAAKPRHALVGFFREVGRGVGAPAGATEGARGTDRHVLPYTRPRLRAELRHQRPQGRLGVGDASRQGARARPS